MKTTAKNITISGALAAVALLLAASAPPAGEAVLVQAQSMEQAAAAVAGVDGRVTHGLDIIDAVGAKLTPAQLERLAAEAPGLRLLPETDPGPKRELPGTAGSLPRHAAVVVPALAAGDTSGNRSDNSAAASTGSLQA